MEKPIENFTTEDGIYCRKLYGTYEPYTDQKTNQVTATGYNLSKSPKVILRAFIFVSRVGAVFASKSAKESFNAKKVISPEDTG